MSKQEEKDNHTPKGKQGSEVSSSKHPVKQASRRAVAARQGTMKIAKQASHHAIATPSQRLNWIAGISSWFMYLANCIFLRLLATVSVCYYRDDGIIC